MSKIYNKFWGGLDIGVYCFKIVWVVSEEGEKFLKGSNKEKGFSWWMVFYWIFRCVWVILGYVFLIELRYCLFVGWFIVIIGS